MEEEAAAVARVAGPLDLTEVVVGLLIPPVLGTVEVELMPGLEAAGLV